MASSRMGGQEISIHSSRSRRRWVVERRRPLLVAVFVGMVSVWLK
jgi:hypothetical protein